MKKELLYGALLGAILTILVIKYVLLMLLLTGLGTITWLLIKNRK